MSETQRVIHPRWKRKAIMAEHGVSASAIAAAVPCSNALVRRVINGDSVYETSNSKKIKRLIAERTGATVAELWSDEDTAGAGSNSQANGGQP